jgi:hypothetical protein
LKTEKNIDILISFLKFFRTIFRVGGRMKKKRVLLLNGFIITVFLLTFFVQTVSAGVTATPLNPPFKLKLTFPEDQINTLDKNRSAMQKSYLFLYLNALNLEVDKHGVVSGVTYVKSEGEEPTSGTFEFSGTYKMGKISGTWTYSGIRDMVQDATHYNLPDWTYEGSGQIRSSDVITKEGGSGVFEGELVWHYQECKKGNLETHACDELVVHDETEPFSLTWTAYPVGDYCFRLRLKNDWGDSRAGFDAITGKVEITCDPDEVDWVPPMMSDIIFVGDHIATRDDSSAIVHFADMSTWVMKPNTEIFIETPPEQETKIGLVLGRLWNNTKKLLFEGTMEIETTQAVAGIKGTTLEMETDGTTTTLKVIAGKVEFSSKATHESVLVNSGEQVSADANGLSEVIPFDTAAEIESWTPFVNDPAVLQVTEGVEYQPEDTYSSAPAIDSANKPGFLRKLRDKLFGKICAGIFPGLAAVVFTFTARRKNHHD